MKRLLNNKLLINQIWQPEKYDWSRSPSSDTILLLHFDENYNDSSIYNCVCNDYSTSYDNINSFTAEQPKFGSTCWEGNNWGYYWDAGRYYSLENANYNIGETDFTIDFWIRKKGDGTWNSGNSYAFLWAFGSASNNYANFYCSVRYNTLSISFDSLYSLGQELNWNLIELPQDKEWHHLAFVFEKSNNFLKFYFDGKWNNKIYVIKDSDFEVLSKQTIYVGYAPLGYYTYTFYHYLDEFRLTKKKIWNKNFIPPSRAYTLEIN